MVMDFCERRRSSVRRRPFLVLGHGAAGFEIDRTDPAVGTPEHTVVLATADGFTDAYQTPGSA